MIIIMLIKITYFRLADRVTCSDDSVQHKDRNRRMGDLSGERAMKKRAIEKALYSAGNPFF